ncbi:helix-turn-helix domain-containing protein [Oscillibacter valericigenes]|uniref:helix-turn-helix domain-containing protein n=1 Tax=Oscillibacter valericigenes TaxID=351091 RepID=UPI001F280361|nr:helix-turn-helix domain-containing protein [Oscillibacter valericigenes]MCF2664663.1 helix-turn-helix domain-containing protein [Oscillibacter valericigenes]
MDSKQIGELLARLRKERGMTQNQVAEALHVSPQAVSKWERGKGCPDISLLPALSSIFGVALRRLLMGDLAPEKTEVGNMRRLKFYVCPDCGNILTATGGGEIHCCGRKLEPLQARPADEAHTATVREIEEDWYVTFSHPMEKDHYFRFAAYVATERVLLVRLYPEQGGEFRIPQLRGGGKLYLCCSRDGLFEVKI